LTVPPNSWRQREAYWRHKLGRLHLGAEPLAEQLDRQRRVNWMLTGVTAGIALLFLALFSAFQAPAIGLVVGGLIGVPIVGLAWIDYAVLKARAARYESERRAFQGGQRNPELPS
jgi:hypothetical protein